MRTMGRLRAALLAVLVLGGVLLVAPAASAGVLATPLTANLTGGAVGTQRDCDGNTLVLGTGISLDVARADDGTGAVPYDLTWGGSLVAGVDYQAPPATGTIRAGEHGADPVTLEPLTDKVGTVTVDVTGPGITPVHAELTTVHQDIPNCALLDTIHAQVVVGTPISLPVGDIGRYVDPFAHDVFLFTVGELVPGTRFSDEFYPTDRKLIGTPTTVGTYTFSLRACAGACFESQTFVVDVVPAGSTPSTTGVGPDGVGTAGGTGTTGTTGSSGGAAAPVSAVAAFTG